MHLVLASATEFEIQKTIRWLESSVFTLNSLKAELLITGVGQMQTAYALQKKINSGKPDLIIQAGIGGCSKKEDLGAVFAISSDRQADLGVLDTSGFKSVFDMGFAETDRYPFRKGKLENPYKRLLELSGLEFIEGITVNEIKSADLPGFKQAPIRIVESMEGAALHYVCLNEGIPFLQIRAVSNQTGDRDKSRWHIPGSIELLNETIISLIIKLSKTDETDFRI